jgi:AcrR family transcriptional regulator
MAQSDPPRRATRSSAATRDNGARTQRSELFENELYERAAQLFADKGFAGTTLQDIADAMGTSRTALYHYVKNKDDLLAKLVAQVSQELAGQLRAVRSEDGPSPEEQLHAMARAMVAWMASRSVRFRLLILSEQDLPPDLAKAHRKAKKTIRDELAAVIADGVRAGVFRPVDEHVAAYAIVGMCNWTAWWFRPGPEHPVDPVVDQIADMALHSLRWADESRHLRPAGPAGVIARLEEELGSLRRMLEDNPEKS